MGDQWQALTAPGSASAVEPAVMPWAQQAPGGEAAAVGVALADMGGL
jgi:hypothetical protein